MSGPGTGSALKEGWCKEMRSVLATGKISDFCHFHVKACSRASRSCEYLGFLVNASSTAQCLECTASLLGATFLFLLFI